MPRPLLVVLILALSATTVCAEPSDEPFRTQVAPILERHCVHCHNPEENKGKLSLASAAEALKGGDSGRVIEPGRPGDSLLVDYISGTKPEMPKGAAPLAKEQVAAIRTWVAAGAKWPEGLVLKDRRAEATTWWSLQPLPSPLGGEGPGVRGRIAVPKIPADSPHAAWPRSDVDRFVLAKLLEQGLAPSREADRRTLIRRVTYDLIGLPPTPEEIEAFVADPDPRAYEQLVDRLLESPRYGERWARHWLDVVHFGETHGYDKDKPRPNAWPYRDYVIRAFNEDRPYGRFVQEQIAGDVLFPGTRDGIEALGFIAAGPWDFIGHAEVDENKIDGKVARHLDRDDMITTTIQTFNSLTIQCAQCHNHKFDPITQEDYYALQAVFAAVDRTDRRYDLDPAVAEQRTKLEREQKELAAAKNAIDAAIAAKAGPRLAELDRLIQQAAAKSARPGKPAEFGYHSAISPKQEETKWVQVDLGASVALARVVLRPCHDDFAGIGDGFGFPVRYRIELSDDPQFERGVVAIADHTAADLVSPGLKPQSADAGGKQGRYLRVTATKLALRQNDYILSLAELEAFDAAGKNIAAGKVVTALDSIEAPVRWRRTNLVDGLFPGVEEKELDAAALKEERHKLIGAATTAEQVKELARVQGELDQTVRRLAILPSPQVAYIGGVHSGSGTFAGTGASGGKPRPIRILKRGSVTNPGEEVGPGALTAVRALSSRFELAKDAGEGERRAALARWLTDSRHPLTWRSIVNRVWQYHFGQGIVATSNDFGKNGKLPTHPELLDWLAVEFRDHGQSLKQLHRLLVTSATYRQSSATRTAGGSPAALEKDADNRFLWRANRRRLEAEAVRDSVLALSGRLDLKMGGPSFQDFVIDKPEHSPHYEYDRYDPTNPASHRRSIYRFIVRSQQQPFMTTLDCADPSMQVDKRNESLSPLQALALLNNSFMTTMAKYYAERLEKAEGSLEARVARAFYETHGRPATDVEKLELVAYAKEHGLTNLCRVLINVNGFMFVE